MKLEKYISDLLYRYDLVIVPDFGAIVGRKKSARVDKQTHVFLPPYKQLSFNINLKESDGLLTRYVADLHSVSNEKALEMIRMCVVDWQTQIRNHKQLKLDQIGIFRLLEEDKIIFMPLTTKNYLTKAYGLSTFYHKPEVSSREIKNVVAKDKTHQEQNTHSPKISRQASKRVHKKTSRNNLLKYAAIFVVGLGLLGGVAGLYNSNVNKETQTFQKATFTLEQNFPTITISGEEKPAVVKTIDHKKILNYHIIGGAFRNKANADKKVVSLTNLGYKATIACKNRSGLFMVAYQGYTTFNEAKKSLKKIRKIQNDAWIYKKEIIH